MRRGRREQAAIVLLNFGREEVVARLERPPEVGDRALVDRLSDDGLAAGSGALRMPMPACSSRVLTSSQQDTRRERT